MKWKKKSKLTFKLLSLFTVLIILVAVIMLISVNLLTSLQFKRFTLDSDVLIARDYSILLEKYYEKNDESWDGVDNFIHSIWKDSRGRMDWLMMNYSSHGNMMGAVPVFAFENSQRLILLDKKGLIISDSMDLKTGEIHPADHWKKGEIIQFKGRTIGTVLYGSMIEPVLNPMDRDFLQSVNWTISLSAALAVLLAIILGYYFVSSIISPLNHLSKAMSQLSEGAVNVQVAIKSEDEINTLADNFNQMSKKLYEANKWRSQLTADISHEIRTPITTIQGELEAIIDGVYPLEMTTIKNIYQDTIILSGIVEDLQLLDSLEVKKQLLHMEEENICTILDNVFNSFKSNAKEKGITIKKECPAEIPMVLLDSRRFRQVLNNLLSNSITYSSQGDTITLSAEIVITEGKKELVISVRDTGIGIAEEHITHIFDRFYRADTSRSRLSGGTGLGLSISKTIVEAHGGRIEAESVIGEGTNIRIFLQINNQEN
ncbi:MAG: ATP-binding protein [Spirochaetaceae bacterium]|jgi:two-component system sensor histidine kinase BaeS|nr:ATP-binding protein [Spirochaetaceae bacterium]